MVDKEGKCILCVVRECNEMAKWRFGMSERIGTAIC